MARLVRDSSPVHDERQDDRPKWKHSRVESKPDHCQLANINWQPQHGDLWRHILLQLPFQHQLLHFTTQHLLHIPNIHLCFLIQVLSTTFHPHLPFLCQHHPMNTTLLLLCPHIMGTYHKCSSTLTICPLHLSLIKVALFLVVLSNKHFIRRKFIFI